MPFSMVIGALFLSIADMIAKISGASGLPVGVITSMVGGPLFVYILIKRGKKVWS
jgi:ABC-type Fe3+-siderophore transport system permease subunit